MPPSKDKPNNRERFALEFTLTVEVEINKSLLPDDEWRSVFYDIYTLKEMAEHIAWNRCVMRFPGQVEGIAVEDEDKFEILSATWD